MKIIYMLQAHVMLIYKCNNVWGSNNINMSSKNHNIKIQIKSIQMKQNKIIHKNWKINQIL